MNAKSKLLVACVGALENANTFVLVSVAADGKLLDRRTIALTAPGVPTHPHHHEGSWAVGRYLETPGARKLPLSEAVALVKQVRSLAEVGAKEGLAKLAAEVSIPIGAIAIRACPELPDTIEARIRDNRAQSMADSVMYRLELAKAAEARGWRVRWYDRDRVRDAATAAFAQGELARRLQAMGKAAGPPWQAKHRLAAAAALVGLRGR